MNINHTNNLYNYDFLKQVLVPSFEHNRKSGLNLALFDTQHKLVFCTDEFLKDGNAGNTKELLGLSYGNLNTELVDKYFKVTNPHQSTHLINEATKITRLQQSVIDGKACIKYLDLLPYNQYYRAYIVTISLVYDPFGGIIGTTLLYSDQSFFSLDDLLKSNNSLKSVESVSIDIHHQLSERQLQIVYLLANGFSQQAIADHLAISRGTVSQTLKNYICPKLGICRQDTKTLKEIAIKLGLHNRMPKSLWNAQIIPLES